MLQNNAGGLDLLSVMMGQDGSSGSAQKRPDRRVTKADHVTSPLYNEPIAPPTPLQAQDLGYDPSGGPVNPMMLLQHMAGTGGPSEDPTAPMPAGTYGTFEGNAVGTANQGSGPAGFSPAMASATPAAEGTFGVGTQGQTTGGDPALAALALSPMTAALLSKYVGG